MTREANIARHNALNLEVQKHGLYQLKEGDWVMRFVLQNGEVPSQLVNAPMGQRFVMALVAVDDMDQPIGPIMDAAAEPPEDRGAVTPAERSAPVNHRLSQQAAMACQDKMFRHFLAIDKVEPELLRVFPPKPWSTDDAAAVVRMVCNVQSRAEFDTDPEAGKRWQKLWSDFFIWSKRPELEDA